MILRPDKDVIILQGGGQSERFAALRAGAVDAAIVSPPLNLTGRSLGFIEVIDLSESGVPYAHQQIVAQKDFMERNPDLILRTLRALIEGLSYWKDVSKKEVVIGHVAKYLRLDPQKNREELEETYRYYGKTFSTKPYPTLEGVELPASDLEEKSAGSRGYAGQGLCDQPFRRRIGKRGVPSESLWRAVVMIKKGRSWFGEFQCGQ